MQSELKQGVSTQGRMNIDSIPAVVSLVWDNGSIRNAEAWNFDPIRRKELNRRPVKYTYTRHEEQERLRSFFSLSSEFKGKTEFFFKSGRVTKTVVTD